MSSEREPFAGRYFGIIGVEGESPEPLALFMNNEDATVELARRRALPEDDDGRLTEFYHVLPCHIAGVLWNSYDTDPRADDPLTAAEIAAEHGCGA